MNQIPAIPGAYALLLHNPDPITLRVGRLGYVPFPAGRYIYNGSACGPGGLRARLGRHLRASCTRTHWHIDTLRQVTAIRAYYYTIINSQDNPNLSVPIECLWSQALAKLPFAETPLPGFGSSDCRTGCTAHLIHIPGGLTEPETPDAQFKFVLEEVISQRSNTLPSEVVFISHPTI